MASFDPEKQRAFAVDVVRQLREAGYEAYWAGGCVRDQLLGHRPKDYDVATAARPEQIQALFGHRKTVAVGAAFGVIAVIGPRGAGQIEAATFRRDATYSDGRHPDAVEYSTAEADAQRRDFTVNGMFFDPLEDRVIDYVGGQDDLARGILRAIGDARARFTEDKLRLLRAVRFAANLDFTLDSATREALEVMAPQVTVVSIERIAAELRAMLVHAGRVRSTILLRETGLLEAVLPEVAVVDTAVVETGDALTATGRKADEAWVRALEVLSTLHEPTFPLALAGLLHPFVDPSGVDALARRWKLSNADRQRTVWLVEHHTALLGARHAPWSKLQRLLVSQGSAELVTLSEAIAQAAGQDGADIEHCRQRLALPADELDPPPLVTGDDLIRLGVPRGKQYPRLLDAVRDAQLDGQITTHEEAVALVRALIAEAP